MGQKRRKIFCVVLNCGENFLLSPTLPPLHDPKFYPSPRAILGGVTSLFEAFFLPSGKKSVPMCGNKHCLWVRLVLKVMIFYGIDIQRIMGGGEMPSEARRWLSCHELPILIRILFPQTLCKALHPYGQAGEFRGNFFLKNYYFPLPK